MWASRNAFGETGLDALKQTDVMNVGGWPGSRGMENDLDPLAAATSR